MKKEDIRKAVKSSMDKVFLGNTRVNEGIIENHSSAKTKEYFVALAKGESWAEQKQKEMINEIKSVDFSFLEDIDEQ